MCVMPLPHGLGRMRPRAKGGRPTKHTKRGPEVVVVEADAPPPP